MELITRRFLIGQWVRLRWSDLQGFQSPDKVAERKTLLTLGLNPTPGDFDREFPDLDRAQTYPGCTCCGKLVEQVVQIQCAARYGMRVFFCGDCLIRALNLHETEC